MGGHNKETIVNIISRHLSSEKHVKKKIRWDDSLKILDVLQLIHYARACCFTTHTLHSSLLFYNSYVTLELTVLQLIRYARACCFTTHTLRSSLLFYNSYVTLELTVLQLIRYARACCFTTHTLRVYLPKNM
jgi:6-phosphogluconate dehydrogenase